MKGDIQIKKSQFLNQSMQLININHRIIVPEICLLRKKELADKNDNFWLEKLDRLLSENRWSIY